MPTFARTAAAIALLTSAAVCWGALPIDLEVATAPDAPVGAMQEWARLLGDMDLARLRLRGANRTDQPAVTTSGSGAATRYTVVAILTRRNELMFPDGVFRQTDRARLKSFLEDLPDRTAEAGVERGPFNLPMPTFGEAVDDLSTVVSAPTRGVAAASVVSAIASQLRTPLKLDAAATAALREAKPVAAELKGMTAGTALAIVLRTADLAFLPVQPRGEALALEIAPIAADRDAWPVGWKSGGSPRLVAPAMFRFTTVEIEGYTLARALTALAPHMGVPLVFDARTLAARKIDIAAVQVKLPAGKTYIRQAVDRILSQARLAGDLRVDERERPFYWITQYGPESPRARESPLDRTAE